jgi:hypothetical protein
VLQFSNGVAPDAGDSFEVLNVAGAVAGAFQGVEVRGLRDPSFAEDLAGGKLTLTSLTDAEPLPTVSLKAKPLVKEAKARKGLKVKFVRKGDTSEALQVAYAVAGTARNGVDYEELLGVIEIPARKKSAELVVRPLRDVSPEEDETIELEVLPGASYTASLASTARIVLGDEVPKPHKP